MNRMFTIQVHWDCMQSWLSNKSIWLWSLLRFLSLQKDNFDVSWDMIFKLCDNHFFELLKQLTTNLMSDYSSLYCLTLQSTLLRTIYIYIYTISLRSKLSRSQNWRCRFEICDSYLDFLIVQSRSSTSRRVMIASWETWFWSLMSIMSLR